MRYYVVSPSPFPQIAPHVIAEVVRDDDALDDLDRRMTLAGAIAGDAAIIATRDELLAHPVGARALRAWERGDDQEFDLETHLLETAPDDLDETHLRLVEETDDVVSDPVTDRRSIVLQAQALRLESRALVKMSIARRQLVAANRRRFTKNLSLQGEVHDG